MTSDGAAGDRRRRARARGRRSRWRRRSPRSGSAAAPAAWRSPAAASGGCRAAGCRSVDLVEEQEVGNAAVLELLEDQLQRRHALGIGLAHHDGGIAGRERERAFVLEFDRAGAIDEGEVVAEECDVGDVELDAHAVVAGFGARIADGVLVGDLALARDGAGAREDGFEKSGLAGEIRPDQCDAAGAGLPRPALAPSDCAMASSTLGLQARARDRPRLAPLGGRDQHVRAAPKSAQARTCEILSECLGRVAGLSRSRRNIAPHNGCEEFVVPIRSSTMENTCSEPFKRNMNLRFVEHQTSDGVSGHRP